MQEESTGFLIALIESRHLSGLCCGDGKGRREPVAFREKVNVICKLYRKAPRNAVVLSIDEKTGIQAIERKHPGRAPAPGRLRRREFEYVRHGTQTLIAALDVHSGQALAECRERRTQDDLVAFMERVALAVPDKQIHVIWDNLNTHCARAVWQAFNTRHG